MASSCLRRLDAPPATVSGDRATAGEECGADVAAFYGRSGYQHHTAECSVGNPIVTYDAGHDAMPAWGEQEPIMISTDCTEDHNFNYHDCYEGPADHEFKAEHDGYDVYVSKIGGGATGELYDGYWAYLIIDQRTGDTYAHGDDLRIDTRITHEMAATQLAEFMFVADE